MSKQLQKIAKQLKVEGKDYTDFKILLTAIHESGSAVTKDQILDFVVNDYLFKINTTPNSIAKLIAHLSQRLDPKNAIDICCGTGNILYYLQNDILNLTGVEIDGKVSELTKYLIPELQIITEDLFNYNFSNKYDLVVGHIPFGGLIQYENKRMPLEEAFLRKSLELVNEIGNVIVWVPHYILFNSQFKKFRKEFTPYLQEVITLRSGISLWTQLKTAIILFTKCQTEDVKFTQLLQYKSLIKEYLSVDKLSLLKPKISDRWDSEYYVARDNDFYDELEDLKIVNLDTIAEIIRGKRIHAESMQPSGDFLCLKSVHIAEGKISEKDELFYISKKQLKKEDFIYILQPGDIIISTISNDFIMYEYQSTDIPAIATSKISIIRSDKKDYISTYLKTDEGKRVFKKQAEDLRRFSTAKYLFTSDLASIKIPILPIDDLNSLGDISISRSTEAELNALLKELAELKIKVQKYHKQSEDYKELKFFIENRFNRVENQLNVVNTKLDSLLSILIQLRSDFEQIQRLPRDEEERLFKLYKQIDAKLESIYNREQPTIENYIVEIKRWLDLWELLDVQSQKFLPIAEFIFDELSKIEGADFAPFVVQYCRTLENEILKKLFETYDSCGLQGINRDKLVKDDLENQKTSKFAQMVKRNKINYTLGDMNFIMALLKQGGNTLGESPLLQHFRTFVIFYFDEKIVEAEFLKDVNKLTTEFRNKAAHPYVISVKLAKECQALLRKSLNVFLESIKS